MKLLIFKRQKEAGFRINVVDIVFILLLCLFSWYIYSLVQSYAFLYLLPLYVGFTFFLFCNVFRVSSKIEIIWTTYFVTISLITFYFFKENWTLITFSSSFMFTGFLIMRDIKSKKYK